MATYHQPSHPGLTWRNWISGNGECTHTSWSLSVYTEWVHTIVQICHNVRKLISLNTRDLPKWHKLSSGAVVSKHINGVVGSWWAEVWHIDCDSVWKKSKSVETDQQWQIALPAGLFSYHVFFFWSLQRPRADLLQNNKSVPRSCHKSTHKPFNVTGTVTYQMVRRHRQGSSTMTVALYYGPQLALQSDTMCLAPH